MLINKVYWDVYMIYLQSTEINKEHDLIYLRYKNNIVDTKKKIESIIEAWYISYSPVMEDQLCKQNFESNPNCHRNIKWIITCPIKIAS